MFKATKQVLPKIILYYDTLIKMTVTDYSNFIMKMLWTSALCGESRQNRRHVKSHGVR